MHMYKSCKSISQTQSQDFKIFLQINFDNYHKMTVLQSDKKEMAFSL